MLTTGTEIGGKRSSSKKLLLATVVMKSEVLTAILVRKFCVSFQVLDFTQKIFILEPNLLFFTSKLG